MAFNQNPLQWKTLKWQTSNPATNTFDPKMLDGLTDRLTSFVGQVGDFCNAVLNQVTQLQSAIASKIVDLGTITTDQSVACAGAATVFVRFTSSVTQARTITLSNLPQGATVMIDANNTSGTLTLKMAATDTAANTYTIIGIQTSTQAVTDMVGTGAAFGPSEFAFFGVSGFVGTSASPRLIVLYS